VCLWCDKLRIYTDTLIYAQTQLNTHRHFHSPIGTLSHPHSDTLINRPTHMDTHTQAHRDIHIDTPQHKQTHSNYSFTPFGDS
jgi:hypothetical protein